MARLIDLGVDGITTVANDEQATTLVQRAVWARCAACVHQDTIRSTYHWQGAVQHDSEVRLTFKTTAAAYGPLEALIRQHHPYELPAIYAVPVARASTPCAVRRVGGGADAGAGVSDGPALVGPLLVATPAAP